MGSEEQLNGGTTTVLVVEDHDDLAATIGSFLDGLGLTTDYAADGKIAMNLATTNHYDCVVLDLMLPKVDGLTVCTQLRDAGVGAPILMLTARDQLTDKLRGFESGADDYLVKPFELAELAARIQALVRRSRGEASGGTLKVHDLELNTRTLQVQRQGKKLNLSPTALRILRVLMRESPNVVTREAIEQELWGDMLPDSDTLRSHLYNLRRELDRPFDDKLLHTVQGMGFRLAAPEEV